MGGVEGDERRTDRGGTHAFITMQGSAHKHLRRLIPSHRCPVPSQVHDPDSAARQLQLAATTSEGGRGGEGGERHIPI